MVKNKFFAKAAAFWNQYLTQLAATSATSRPTRTVPPPTTTTVTRKSQSLNSSYMIATYLLFGIALLLLATVVVLACKIKKSNYKYKN